MILIFGVLGWLVGVVVNLLADELPRRRRLSLTGGWRPLCATCAEPFGGLAWSGVGRWILGRGHCPHCHHSLRRRPPLLEAISAVIFALLPVLIPNPVVLGLHAAYIAILLLITVIDLEHKLILDVVVAPALALALVGSLVVPPNVNTLASALSGAAVGFGVFGLFYWIGKRWMGAGALGFGDVKLALLIGAMVGFAQIFLTLALAVVLGAVVSVVLLALGRVSRTTALPYGQYLAIAAIVMLIWGTRIMALYW